MNVLEDPNGLAELQKLGARSVPVLSRGDKFTFGQSTKQIVDFLGLNEKSGPELSTDELAARVDKYMGAALELIPMMPHDRLGTFVPGRPRSYRTLGFHLFRVVAAFLDANEGTTLVQAAFREEPPADADTLYAWLDRYATEGLVGLTGHRHGGYRRSRLRPTGASRPRAGGG